MAGLSLQKKTGEHNVGKEVKADDGFETYKFGQWLLCLSCTDRSHQKL